MKNTPLQSGYSLIEMIVVIVLFIILTGFVTINLLNSQHSASIQSGLVTILGDIKGQQVKAMQGDTEGRGLADYYGIHFASNAYTLFHGNTYNQNDTANLTIPLDQGLQFTSINLTNGNIIFIPLNGEIYGYSPAANSLTLHDQSGQKNKTIQFNYLGIITSLN